MEKQKTARGYVLFDVLLGVFLFSVGFAVLFGLTERALAESRQASDLVDGVNLAQQRMESLAARSWDENIAAGDCIPGGTVEGREGKFWWQVYLGWEDEPRLLRVRADVRWLEQGMLVSYTLESLYAVD